MPKKIKIPVADGTELEVEPIEAMIEESAAEAVQAASAAAETTKAPDRCCEIKLPLDLSGAGMGTHLDNIFRSEGVWNPVLQKYQYKLLFEPSQRYEDIMQGYTNYVKAIYPCITSVDSAWSLSEENHGPGHTTRRKARTFFTRFVPNGSGVISFSQSWNEYFDAAVPDGSSDPVSALRGLDFNQIYSIQLGTWLNKSEDCEIPRERECLWGASWTNFNFRTSPDPL